MITLHSLGQWLFVPPVGLQWTAYAGDSVAEVSGS